MFKPLRLVRAGTQIPFVGFLKVEQVKQPSNSLENLESTKLVKCLLMVKKVLLKFATIVASIRFQALIEYLKS